jgi:hypothetical protein
MKQKEQKKAQQQEDSDAAETEKGNDKPSKSHRGSNVKINQQVHDVATSSMGMSVSWSAVLATFLQWTGGSMLIVYVSIVAAVSTLGDDNTVLEIWNDMYGTVVYHWSTLVTLVCVHNVASCFNLQTTKLIKEEAERRQTGNSDLTNDAYRWWVWVTSGAMLTWWWAEKKQDDSAQVGTNANTTPTAAANASNQDDSSVDDVYTSDHNRNSNNGGHSMTSEEDVSSHGAGSKSYSSVGAFSDVGGGGSTSSSRGSGSGRGSDNV